MYLAMLLLAFVLCLLVPQEIQRVSDEMRQEFWKNMGIGFIVLVVGTFSAVVAAFTLIGLPLAFIVFAGFISIWLVAQVAAGLFFGNLIFKSAAGSKWKLFGRLALGLFVYIALGLIPVFGLIFTFLFSLLGFGTFLRRRHEMFHFLKMKKYW